VLRLFCRQCNKYTEGISSVVSDEQGVVHEDCVRRERVRRLLQVQERLHQKVEVHVCSGMHGRPMVHCIWSSVGYFSGLSMNG
jgi:signal transduction protein with GAF and PtsI domain